VIHFWFTAIGVILYWVGLTCGGVLQGMLMNDPNVPFLDIVRRMVPFLWSRTVAAILLSIGHIAFAINLWFMIRRRGEWLAGPTLFRSGRRLRDLRREAPAQGAAS
jgi:cytochrome c oxidase cbb3-type subunit 1